MAAFGRLMWYAIVLEDCVSAVCWQVQPGMWDLNGHDPSTSVKIAKALKVLDKAQSHAAKDTAAWLTRCQEELDHKRNALLHSVPLMMPGYGEAPGPRALGIMPRGDRPYLEMPMMPQTLEPLTGVLKSLADQWADISHALANDAQQAGLLDEQ